MPVDVAERYGHKARLEGLQAVAQRKGGRCLASAFLGTDAKLEFECGQGHRWHARARAIRDGIWCPMCRRRPLVKLLAMQAIARARGGRCLSDEYIVDGAGMRWRCARGHEWEATPVRIRGGSWCPRCANRLTMDDMQALAARHGGRCLSESLADGSHDRRMLWECAQGHRFAVRRRCVAVGQWCPECRKADGSWKQAVARAQQLGGACLADGEQRTHDSVEWRCAEGHTWHCSAYKISRGSWCPRCEGRRLDLEQMQAMAAEHGGRCLSREFVNVQAELEWECAQGHRWSAPPLGLRYRNLWCPTCRGKPRTVDVWQQALAQAEKHGGSYVGGRRPNNNLSARWRCAAGHVFTKAPDRVVAGRWCLLCSERRLSIETMRAMAAERGGRCISRKYVDAKTKLQWECDKGHRWWAMPGGLRNAGSWCPQCAWDRLSELKRGDAKDRR